MECYAHGYPAPRLSWYKEVDPNNPTALIPLTEKTFKLCNHEKFVSQPRTIH